MDHSSVFSLELKRQLNKQQDLFGKILDTLQVNGVNVTGAKALLSSTPTSIRQQKIAELLQMWEEYKLPCYTLEELHLIIQQHRETNHSWHKDKELDKHRTAYSDAMTQGPARVITIDQTDQHPGASMLHQPSTLDTSVPPPLAAMDVLPFELSKYTVQMNKTLKGINPQTLQMFDRPIQYVFPVLLQDFQDLTTKFPLTTIIDIESTIKKYLGRAQDYGLNKFQFSELLRRFIDEHFKEFAFVIEHIPVDNYDAVFTNTVNLINTTDVVSNINSTLEALVRSPGQSIHGTFLSYKSLLQLRFKHTETHLTLQQIDQKADRVARAAIQNFVSDNCKHALHQWISERKEYGETVDSADMLNFISDLETKDPRFKLTEPKSAASFIQQINVDLYKTQFNMTRSQTKKDPKFNFLSSPKDRKSRSMFPFSSTPKKNFNSKSPKPRSNPTSPIPSRSPSSSRRSPSSSKSPSRSRDSRPTGTRPKTYNKNSKQKSHSPQNSNKSSRHSSRSNASSRSSSRGSTPNQLQDLQKDFQSLQQKFNKLLKCRKCFGMHTTCPLYKKEAPNLCDCKGGFHFRDKCLVLNKKN